MKWLFTSLATLIALTSAADATARSALEGRWKDGRMEIVIRPCGGGTLCGMVVKASDKQQARAQRGSGKNLLGARVIDNIEPTGAGVYRADVYVADRDVTARGTIHQMGPNRLNVRGCVLVVICKTTNWDRLE